MRRARDVGNAQNRLVAQLAHIGEHRAVGRADEGQRAAAEHLGRLAHADQPLGPVQQRGERARLRLDVDGGEAVDRVHDAGQVELRRIGAREAAVAVRRPLHRRAHAVAVAEIDVVAHADLVAVIDDRRAGHGHHDRVHQIDLAAVVLHQRRQPPADAEIDARARVGGVGRPQIVALGVGHHLERQFVMVAQEHGPLAVVRDFRGLPHDVGDREAVFLRDRHVDARHQREVIGHVAFVAVAEIGPHVLRPLVSLRQQHLAWRIRVEFGAQPLQHGVCFRQVFVVGALALAEIGHRVEAESVDPRVEPALHHLRYGAHHARIVEVQVGLVRREAVPVEGLRLLVPGPVRLLGVAYDDARALVFLVAVAPDVPVARARPLRAAFGALEPVVLIGCVVGDELRDHPQIASFGFLHEAAEVLHGAKGGVDGAVVRDVVAVVAAGARIERHQPQRGDAEVAQIVELLGQPGEIADAVAVAVGECLDVQLINDGVLEPQAVIGGRRCDIDRTLIVVSGRRRAEWFHCFRDLGSGSGQTAQRAESSMRAVPAEPVATQ